METDTASPPLSAGPPDYPDLAHSCGWPLTFMVCRGIRRLRRRGRHCSHGRSSEPSKQRKRFQIEVRGMMPAWRCTAIICAAPDEMVCYYQTLPALGRDNILQIAPCRLEAPRRGG